MIGAIIAAVGTVVSAVGLGMSASGAKKQEKAQKRIAQANAQLSKETTAISLKQEELRRQQLEMEALRAQRASIRETQLARASGLANASAQGAMTSTSYLGGQAQITSQGAAQQSIIYENLQRGRQQFALNEQLLKAQNENAQKTGQYNAQLASASTLIDYGRSLYSLGGSITNNAEKASNVIQSLYPRLS